MTKYKVTLECKQDGKMPIITPAAISKEQHERILAIIQETHPRREGNGYGHDNRRIDV